MKDLATIAAGLAPARSTGTALATIDDATAARVAVRQWDAGDVTKATADAINGAVGARVVTVIPGLDDGDREGEARQPRYASPAQIADAQRIAAMALVPASAGGATIAEAITRALAALMLTTVRREADTQDDAARIAVYRDALAHFPADVVREVLAPGRWRFFPALAELTVQAARLHAARCDIARQVARWKAWTVGMEREMLRKQAADARFTLESIALHGRPPVDRHGWPVDAEVIQSRLECAEAQLAAIVNFPDELPWHVAREQINRRQG